MESGKESPGKSFGIGVLQSIFAAFAFGGASFLFKHLEHNNYVAEIKRHNAALEQLQKAKEKFYENEVRHHDKIQEMRQEVADANRDMDEINKSFELLRKIRTIQYNGVKFSREPNINDFYKPSPKMKEYQNIVVVLSGIGVGYAAYKIV